MAFSQKRWNVKTATGTISLVAVSAVVMGMMLVGCGSKWQNYDEKLLETSESGLFGQDAPAWVKGTKVRMSEDEADRIYFVGRSIGYNTFDERAAYDSARDHVLEQVGRQIATWVNVRTTEIDRRNYQGGEKPLSVLLPFFRKSGGPRFLPGEKADQQLAVRIKTLTSALTGDLIDEGVYWEKWSILEEPLDQTLLSNTATRTMKRYKCWVRMSISKEQLESRIKTTMEALEIAAKSSGPGKLYSVSGKHTADRSAVRLAPAGAARLSR